MNYTQMPSRALVSQNDSARIENGNVPRSRFQNSWTRKTAFDAGYLVPILVDEVLPGDHLSYNITAYLRMSTPLFPLLDNQRVDTFFFFVPARLLWFNWQRFMGEQQTPAQSIDITLPLTESPVGGYAVGSIFDHMGLPTVGQTGAANQYTHQALPLRAYNLIYNEWFRDENIINSVDTNVTSDGPDATGDYTLLRRAKAHDYFTSALPWPQKFTAPTIPVSGTAPVTGIGLLNDSSAAAADFFETATSLIQTYTINQNVDNTGMFPATSAIGIEQEAFGGGIRPAVYANLTAVSVTVNALRQAFLVQQLLERDARGGTRYTEIIRNHFRVISPDFRLQRPEYIGGGQSPLVITPIAQTAPTAGVPLGALGAAGTSAGDHRASYASTEHGYIIGLINVRSELSYQQGLHKLWSRSTRYDFYWPTLAGLGEQAILRKEIYHVGDSTDNNVFGYQERWHEYRQRTSEVTGIMRSTAAGTIDMWHLGQNFASAPTLNQTFIQDTPPMTRVLAAGSSANGQQYLADILFQRNAVRPIPTFGTPVTLGRF